MSHRQHPTRRLSSEEIERVREAAEKGGCLDCARLGSELEERRRENHTLRTELHAAHVQRDALVALVSHVQSEVRQLAARVEALTAGAPT